MFGAVKAGADGGGVVEHGVHRFAAEVGWYWYACSGVGDCVGDWDGVGALGDFALLAHFCG